MTNNFSIVVRRTLRNTDQIYSIPKIVRSRTSGHTLTSKIMAVILYRDDWTE